jgi:hypothetical protein
MAKLTQRDKIIRHLEAFGTITPMEAIRDYGIMRLASRVSELRKEGYIIVTDMVHGYNRFNEKTRYAEYHLGG